MKSLALITVLYKSDEVLDDFFASIAIQSNNDYTLYLIDNSFNPTTEQLIITNDGTGPAVIINQLGNLPILQLQGTNTKVFEVTNEGLISVGVNIPSAKIDISANNSIGLKINQYNDTLYYISMLIDACCLLGSLIVSVLASLASILIV
jgi:hypothetical protein